MDILRKELNEIYSSQNLNDEQLPAGQMDCALGIARNFVEISNGCAVITDASCDRCHIFAGDFAILTGLSTATPLSVQEESSDEDIIYNRIHPEDLVDKRLLEYEFFKNVINRHGAARLAYIAKCRIRIADRKGKYIRADNTTQLIRLSPAGKIWLILCTYALSSSHDEESGINPHLIDTSTGEVEHLSLGERRRSILTAREKEILLLIKSGNLSKQIADILGISIHTVNRHRQNVIEKLSVRNSIEAITAATLMGLI